MASIEDQFPLYPDVEVELTGQDGNVFTVFGRVSKALKRFIGDEAAAKFADDVAKCDSYDEALRLAMRTVEVV